MVPAGAQGAAPVDAEGAAPGEGQEGDAEAAPPPAPLGNPVSAAIAGDEPEPPAEQAPDEEPWVPGHEGEVPVYDDEGFGAGVEAYDEGFDGGGYGGELEDGESEPFEER